MVLVHVRCQTDPLNSRLDTLRSIISEYNNLAKTPKPIQSDIQLLSLIEKRVTEAKEAVQEFARANRPDLKEKQDAQIAVLDEYASQVETMRQEEIHAIVSQQISKMKEAGENNLNIGVVMRGLSRDGDPFKGKAHMGKVAEVIKGVLSQK